MDGIIVINKEENFTSHDVVAKLRGILRMKKIGHTGTLDPMARGVLPVAIGQGTRLVEFLTEKQKTYRAVLRLGVTTDTQDITGTVLTTRELKVDEEMIRKASEEFLGEYWQIPPMYSAIKIEGKRLYELAREGKTVERPARQVWFHSIHILSVDLPFVTMEVTCSKGTYIRTLCHDLGEKLGCGGCMEQLLRTRSGDFCLEESHTLQEVEHLRDEGRLNDILIPVEKVLKDYPAVSCIFPADRLLDNGNPLQEELVPDGIKTGWIRMHKSDGTFCGLYEWREHKKSYFPVKMFRG